MQRPLLAVSLLAMFLLLMGRAWRTIWLDGQNGDGVALRFSVLPQHSPLASPLVPEQGQARPEQPMNSPAIASPLATPTVTSVPPQLIRSEQLPAVANDLLFLADNSLKRWNHHTGQVENLLGPESASWVRGQQPVSLRLGPGPPTGAVIDFAVSQGSLVAVTVWRRVPNGETTVPNVVSLFDLESHQLTPLPTGNASLSAVTLSPDGRWLAWVQQGYPPSAQRPPGLAAQVPVTTTIFGSPFGVVYLAPTFSLQDARPVGQCGGVNSQTIAPCGPLFWSADSQQLLWPDPGGVWRMALGNAAAASLVALNAGPRQVQSLSPSGRYWLTRFAPYMEGYMLAVLDIETGRAVEVPGSFEYTRPNVRALWLADDRLFLTRPYGPTGEASASLELWRILPSEDEMLQLEESAAIPVPAGNFPTAPVQVDERRVLFAVLNANEGEDADRGLYAFDPVDNSVRKLIGLPPLGRTSDSDNEQYLPEGLYWPSDGSGVLVNDDYRRQLIYAPAEGNRLYDITPLLGTNPCCFVWLNQ